MGGFYSVRTSTPNMWAYQMFPGGTPYSITNPQDSIGNYNDIQLTNFDYTADFLPGKDGLILHKRLFR